MATDDDVYNFLVGLTANQQYWVGDDITDSTVPLGGLDLHLGLQHSEHLATILTAMSGYVNGLVANQSKLSPPAGLDSSDEVTINQITESGYDLYSTIYGLYTIDEVDLSGGYTNWAGRCQKVGFGPIDNDGNPHSALTWLWGALRSGAGTSVFVQAALQAYTNGRIYELAAGAGGLDPAKQTTLNSLLTTIEGQVNLIKLQTGTLAAGFAQILTRLGIEAGDTLAGLVEQYLQTYEPDGTPVTLGDFCSKWFKSIAGTQTNLMASANLVDKNSGLYPLSAGFQGAVYYHNDDPDTKHHAFKTFNGLDGEGI